MAQIYIFDGCFVVPEKQLSQLVIKSLEEDTQLGLFLIKRLPILISSDCGDLKMEGVSSWDKKLLISSFDGYIGGVRAALAQGGRVTVRSPQGTTPLLAAARNGHRDICGLLLAHGSNVNEVVPDTKQTALHLAATHGHNDSVEALLSWRAEVNPQDHEGWTPLHGACQEGHLLCVLTLLKAGASLMDYQPYGYLPIHLAAQENRVEVIRTLLEHGCSPDMVSW